MSFAARFQNRFAATPKSSFDLFESGVLNKNVKLHKAAAEIVANRTERMGTRTATLQTALPPADRIAFSHAVHGNGELRELQSVYNGSVSRLRSIEHDISAASKQLKSARSEYNRDPRANAAMRATIGTHKERLSELSAEHKQTAVKLGGDLQRYHERLQARVKNGVLTKLFTGRKWSDELPHPLLVEDPALREGFEKKSKLVRLGNMMLNRPGSANIAVKPEISDDEYLGIGRY